MSGNYAGGLGRLEHFDARNLDYLIGDNRLPSDIDFGEDPIDRKLAILASRAPTAHEDGAPLPRSLSTSTAERRTRYYNDAAWWGDQGSAPACTAFALSHAMADGPVTHPGQNPIADPMALYGAIVQRDRAAGRVYAEGATSLAMAQEAQARGWISEYRWGYTLADAIEALKVGPILLGIDWYEGMDYPDRAYGIIRAAGRIRGGHEIECNGLDLVRGFVRLKQSWGRQWGKNGHAILPLEDLETLIADGGDVCQFTERKTDDPRTKKDESK